jgi:hypothetical protein
MYRLTQVNSIDLGVTKKATFKNEGDLQGMGF